MHVYWCRFYIHDVTWWEEIEHHRWFRTWPYVSTFFVFSCLSSIQSSDYGQARVLTNLATTIGIFLLFLRNVFCFSADLLINKNKNQKYVWPRHFYWGKRTVGVSFYTAVRQFWDWRLQTRFKTRLQTRLKIGSEGRRNRVWNSVYKRVWNRQSRHSKIVVRCLFSDSDMS